MSRLLSGSFGRRVESKESKGTLLIIFAKESKGTLLIIFEDAPNN